MSSIAVGPVAADDIDQVMEIDAAVYSRPWSKRLWQAELGKDKRLYLCARDGDRVLGVGGAMFVGEDAHVMTVAVDPARQRAGIATKLLLALVHSIIDRGVTRVSLEVRVSNTGAQALYQRFGFVPVGSRRRYYEPDGEDALVMWLEDVQADDYRHRLEGITAELESVA
ncbi:MAG: ribosomal protein S18-alanine N-acetyltransferase [Acidimicrobiales bacterium]